MNPRTTRIGLLAPYVLLGFTACGSSSASGGSPMGGAGAGGAFASGGSSATAGSSVGGADPELFDQAPHCPSGQRALLIEGTLDATTIVDDRTDPLAINGGFVNGSSGHFDTPPAGSLPLQPEQVELHFQWGVPVAFGQSTVTTGGTLIAPSTHPRAGQPLCITQGKLGFPSSGDENGAFKFRISEAREGADCSGALVPIDLRGCMSH